MSRVVACWFWEWVQRPQENVAFWRWRKWKKYGQLISLYVSINHPEWFISDPDLIQLRLFRVLDTDSAPFRQLSERILKDQSNELFIQIKASVSLNQTLAGSLLWLPDPDTNNSWPGYMKSSGFTSMNKMS